MNIGFDIVSEGAKPKRATEDAPVQEPMRPAKLRRNPDSGQKAVRRQLRRKTAMKVPTPRCPVCTKTGEMEVDPDGFSRWRRGEFIQDAFPDMSADDREQLKTGIHPACWDKLFGEASKTASPDDDYLSDTWGPGSINCPLCGGDGHRVDGSRCPMCMGDGKVTKAQAQAALQSIADTHHPEDDPVNRHDLGNEPIGKLPGAPIMEGDHGEGRAGWGYLPYPSYREHGGADITYVDEHGNRSKTPPKMPRSQQGPASPSYIPPNTWAASLKESTMQRHAFDPENDADWDTMEIEETARDIERGICPLCTERLSAAPESRSFPGYHQQCIEDREKYGSRQRESNVNFNRREAELLSAMSKATLAEQQVLAAELEDLRAQRTASIADDRAIGIGEEVVRDHLTPVLTHALNTTATDWLGDEGEEEIDTEAAVQMSRAEAGAWFSRTSSFVREDREEFAEQAQGKARVIASQFGSAAAVAERTFLDTVAFLHRMGESAVVTDPLPDSAPGPQNPTVEPSYEEARAAGQPYMDDPNLAEASVREAAGDSPGKVDENQSGNAESQITDYNTEGNDDEPFDEKINGPLPQTGPSAVPSTRAPNVHGSLQATATYYCNTHKVYVGDGNRDTHAGCNLEQRKKSEGADSQNGNANSSESQVEVGDKNDRPMWPWEMPNIGSEGPATGDDAANVGGVHTPGQGVADYPQPKKGGLGEQTGLTTEAGFPLCAAGCNTTLSASDQLVNTRNGLAHAACITAEAGGGLDNLGDSKAPPFGSKDDDDDDSKKEGSLVAEGEYHYVHKRGDKWVITQKGTGKVLSTHDSEEKAKASFRAMMQSKHGSAGAEGIDTGKLAAFRERVAANIGS